MVSHVGQKIHVRIDPVQIGNELLDYFKVDVMQIDTSQVKDDTTHNLPSFNHSSAPLIPDKIIHEIGPVYPKVNSSFHMDIDKINYLLLHRRLKHVSDKKMCIMCKNQTIIGLPIRMSQHLHECGRDCWICHAAAIIDVPKGITMSTTFLLPGVLIHMDFYFMNVTSVRGFSCVLNIVDAKTRKK